MISKFLIVAPSVLFAGLAHAQSVTPIEQSINSVKQVVKIDEKDSYVISGIFSVAGNGAQQNPTATLVISIDGNVVDTKVFNWKDGPANFPYSAAVTLEKGTHGLWVRETFNARATATGLTVMIKRSSNVPIPSGVVF